MRAAFALVLMLPCLAQVLPRQTVPGRNSGKPVPVNGVIESVQVDAVAVDSTGRLATGLGAADFEVLHDGRAQKVGKVEFVDTRERRTAVLVVDDLGLTAASMRQVRLVIQNFVAEQMKPADRIAILRTSGGPGWMQQLTSDKSVLQAAAERLDVSPWTRAEASAESREQALAFGLGTVRHAIDYLREEPGRKAVVLISENLRERIGSGRGMALATAFDDLAKMTDVGSVVFYAIDPRGLETQTMAPAAAPEGRQAPVISFSSNATRGPDSGMTILARDTGGMIVDQNRDVAAGLARVMQDLEGYYIITYRPDDTSFTVATGGRRFENLTVKSKRPDLMVRARNGNLPVPAKPGDDDSLYAIDENWRARVAGSPFAVGGIRMRVTPLFENLADSGSFVEAITHVDTRDLTFVQGLDGTRNGVLDVVLAAYGELGSMESQGSSAVTVKLPEESYQRSMRDGLVFVLRLQVRKPGLYLLTVGLRDDPGGKIGAASGFVEIPDVSKDLAISGLYLQGELSAPAKAGGVGDTKAPSENAAVRIFGPGAKMGFGYTAFNLQTDKDGRSVVEVGSAILRDGAQVYTGTTNTLTFEPSVDGKRRAALGNVALAKDTPPGHYVLRVTVADKQAPAGAARPAVQYMDFEVKP